MNDLRRIHDRWRRLDVTLRDAPLAVLLAGASLVPAFAGYGTQIGGLPNRPLDAPAFAVIVLECVPLVVRRRRPGVCVWLVAVGFALDQFLGYHTVAGTALLLALVSAGAHLDRRRRLTAVLLSVGYLLFVLVLVRLGSTERPDDLIFFYLALALGWAVGAWLRHTRSIEAERRHRIAVDTRTAERTRIARELHDVVTHHVTAMVVQAESARYLTADPERLDQALTAVTGTGRRAITDLRQLLDLLDPGHGSAPVAPQPTDLSALVRQARDAGQPVELIEQGTAPDGLDSAESTAYRVVQEALTNAMKYAHGRATVVRISHHTREISVEVITEGSAAVPTSPGGSGRGLRGLDERVQILGGDFTAGSQPNGGFVVRASIPTGDPT
ncbi:sensor histidine kinase [Microlunatus soli]|uniref:histidine kinase n=1 Tax=Microlunatus soli TaxID=630515 RepID=A0A1H2AE56_9ACTN|nr:histidine kinase [Microlunatus soli]SDT44119.1 Signal transduction histidine kinase [Microlunatus soli]